VVLYNSLCLLVQIEPVKLFFCQGAKVCTTNINVIDIYEIIFGPMKCMEESDPIKNFPIFVFVRKHHCLKLPLWFHQTASVYALSLNQFVFFLAKAPKQVHLVSMSMMFMK
jgi:hypothetical protein